MSSVQRNAALTRMNYPPEKLPLLNWSVDTKFWRPMLMDTDMICAVGREMRDYGTLLLALKDLNIPCHIAAGAFRGKKDAWITAVEQAGPLPAHITIGRKNYLELRELYARSRFLVMPILETDTDNGTTSILEAMAMGKAVICSRTQGQVDVIQDGKTGIFVPINDPDSLKNAIQYLWNNPEVADEMGKAGRQWVEKHHSLELWVGNLKTIVSDVITEKGRTIRQ
jgi:glycosyltransferase involved in cell wall biosynthesis